MKLERAQTGLLAALAATASISIFASETLLALSLLVLAAGSCAGASGSGRPASTRRSSPSRSGRCSPPPSRPTRPARTKTPRSCVLFALFYVALEVMARDAGHERVLSAVLLGGLALATLVVLQHHFLGYDRSTTGRPASSATT